MTYARRLARLELRHMPVVTLAMIVRASFEPGSDSWLAGELATGRLSPGYLIPLSDSTSVNSTDQETMH